MLGNAYPFYISSYVEFSILLNKKINISSTLKKFDEIVCKSKREEFSFFHARTLTFCIYALSVNNPSFALPEIIKKEEFFRKTNLLKTDLIFDSRFDLIVYFALEKWDICLQLIHEIEANKCSLWSSSLYCIIKLMCLYEKKDLYYLKSLVTQYMWKRKKKKIKLKDATEFNDCVFAILYFMAKDSKINLSGLFSNVLATFDKTCMELRYLVHWIVRHFPELYNEEYSAFLEKHSYQHYDFQNPSNN